MFKQKPKIPLMWYTRLRTGILRSWLMVSRQRLATSRGISRYPLSAIRCLLFVVALTGVFLYTRAGMPARVEAATSSTLNFQARLLNGSGSIVADGDYNVEFKLYRSESAGASSQGVCAGGGSDDCLWIETRTGGSKVTVKNGYLSVHLGDLNPFPTNINWDQNLYLSMNIGGVGSPTWDGEMTPRLKLTSVPFAQAAKNVYSSSTNSASTNSDGISIHSGDALGATSNSGNITIDVGTATGTTGTISVGVANTSGITIGHTGVLTSIGGSLTVNGSQFTNNGSTLNGVNAFGDQDFTGSGNTGFLGASAAVTVDVDTAFTVGQTTVGQDISLHDPTDPTAGRLVYVLNTGSVSFTMHGVTIPAGYGQMYIWNGSDWRLAASGGGAAITLQAAYDAGNTVLTTDGRDAVFTLADTLTDPNFRININSGSTGEFQIENNGSDVLQIGAAGQLQLAVQGNTGGLLIGGDTQLYRSDQNTLQTESFKVTNTFYTLRGADYSTTGSLDDFDFGDASLVRLTGASTQTLTGIANGTDGRLLTIVNAAGQTAFIANDSGASSAGNKIYTGTGSNLAVPAGSSVILIYDAGANYWRVIGSAATASSGNGAPFVQGGNSFGVDAELGTNDTHDLIFKTDNTQQLTLTTAGNLQFANGADRTLSVAQETASNTGRNLTIAAGQGGVGGAAGGVLVLQGGAAAGSDQDGGNITIDGGAPTGSGNKGTVVIQGTGGNVGIGTTAPLRALDINSANGQNLRLIYNDADGAATNYADFLMGSNGTLSIQARGTDGDLELNTGSFDDAIYIDDSTQSVGIGTASPTATLDVNGTLQASGSATLNGGISIDRTLTVDSGGTQDVGTINFTTPVDTTGTNTSNGLYINTTISNATGGTNTANVINIGDITGDDEVALNGIRIGNLTGSANTAEYALNIGTGWDSVLRVNGTEVIDGSGNIVAGQIAGTLFSFDTDTGSPEDIVQGDTITVQGSNAGIDVTHSGDTITIDLNTAEINTTTFGDESGAFVWTFDATSGTDVQLTFGDNILTVTSATTSFTGNLQVADDKWIGLGSGAGLIEFDDQATDEVNILNANVGLGTSIPTERLQVDGNILTNGDVAIGNNGAINGGALSPFGGTYDNVFSLQQTFTDLTSTNLIEGITNYILLDPAANASAQSVAIDNRVIIQSGNANDIGVVTAGGFNVDNQGDGTGEAYGLQASIFNRGNGVLTTATGGYFTIQNIGGGTIDTATGVKIANGGSGGVTTAIGLEIETQTTSPNNVNLYISDGNPPASGDYSILNTSTYDNLFGGTLIFSGVTTDITSATDEDLVVVANGTGAITIDSETTGAVNLGTGTSGAGKTVTIGNANGTTGVVIHTGTGGASIGDDATAKTINIGGNASDGTDTILIATNDTSADTITIGNSNVNTAINLTAGTTGGISIGGLVDASSPQALCLSGGKLSYCDTDNTSGTNILQGGNTLGETVSIGSNDGQSVALRTAGTDRFIIDSTGANATFQQATTLSTSTGNLSIQAAGTSTLSLETAGAGTVNIATANTTVVNIATNDIAHTIAIGSGGSTAGQTIAIGSSNGGSTTAIRGGTGASAITIQTGGGTIGIGNNAVATNIEIGNTTGTSSLLLQSGSGNTTLTTPTVTLTNDTNFVLSGGVNGVSFDGTTLSVDSSNHRVGVGTAAPAEELDVVGDIQASHRLYVPATSGTLGQGYFTGNATTTYGSFQSLDLLGATFSFFANNKYWNGSAWVDNGLGRKGSSFQIQDDNFTFYSFDTGTTATVRLMVASGGNVGIGGDLTPDGLLSVGSTSQFQVNANGDITTTANTSEALNINTGNHNAGVSGAIGIASGTGTTGSGAITVATGTTSAGASGAVSISSGNATGGNSGNVSIDSGTSNATAGSVNIATGNAPTVNVATNNAAHSINIANNAGSAQTIQVGGNFTNGGSNANSSIKLQAGTVGIDINRGGTGTGDAGGVTLQTFTNDDNAFRILDQSNNVVLRVDTNNSTKRIFVGVGATAQLSTSALVVTNAEVNTRLLIGTTTNGISLDVGASAGQQFRLLGNARNDRGVALIPEFPGATLTGDGSDNIGTMTSDFCSGSSVRNVNSTFCATGNEHNFYQWTTTQSSAQDYDVYVRWLVPSDFDSADASSTVMSASAFRSSSGDSVVVSVYDDNDAIGSPCGSATITSSNGWNDNVSINVSACDFDAGELVVIRIRLTATNGNSARIGELGITYKSVF